MKFKLKTLTPIHIGSGKSLEPFEYIIQDETYYRLNQDKAFIYALEKHSDFPQKFEKWIESSANRIESERDNKKQTELRSNFNFHYFCENILNDKELTNRILKEAFLYKCAVPVGIQGKKLVDELLKDPNQSPYIPGSTIKGAIRTALLFKAFGDLEIAKKKSVINSILNSRNFRETKGRDLDTFLEEEIFICGERNRRDNSINFSNIQLDILKFIHITDANIINAKIAVYPANLYFSNKEPQSQTNAQEVIIENSEFEFDISANTEEIVRIFKESNKDFTSTWINFGKKFQTVFSINLKSVSKDVLESMIINSILNSLKLFGNSVINGEREWVNNYRDKIPGNHDSINADISNIRRFYESLTDDKSFIRIGWGSGFMGTTIFNLLKNDELLKPFISEVISKFKIGIPPNKKNDSEMKEINLSKFPKSKRFSSANTINNVFLPFGWGILLKPNEEYSSNVSFETQNSNLSQQEDNDKITKAKELSEEEIIIRNSARKYIQGDIVEVKYLRNIDKTVYVKLLDSRYLDSELTVVYPAYNILKDKVYFKVQVVQISGGKIKLIKFKGFN